MSRTSVFLVVASVLLMGSLDVYAQGGYGGPSLLSRGGNSPGRRGRAPVNFRYYGAIRAMHEAGLIAPTLDSQGGLTSTNVDGVQFEGGAYGAHSFKRASVGLDYRGDYRYSTYDLFNGSNQALSLDWQGEPTRRISYYIRETLGTTNRAFGGFAAPAFADQDNFGVPLNEVFDSRTYYNQTSASAMFQKTARTAYRVSVDGFFVKRQKPLISTQGYRTGIELLRRTSRATTLGVGYNYIHFEYPGIYGGSDIHLVYGAYQRRLTRNVGIRVQLGAFRSETTGTQRITLPPEIALILGRTEGVAAFRRVMILPQVTTNISYTLDRSRFYVTYNDGATPGNGIYITSRMQAASTGLSYLGIRRMSLGASIGYTNTRSVGLQLGTFRTLQGGGGMSYNLAKAWAFNMQADRRRFTSPGAIGRSGYAISAGISFSPGELPLSIW